MLPSGDAVPPISQLPASRSMEMLPDMSTHLSLLHIGTWSRDEIKLTAMPDFVIDPETDGPKPSPTGCSSSGTPIWPWKFEFERKDDGLYFGGEGIEFPKRHFTASIQHGVLHERVSDKPFTLLSSAMPLRECDPMVDPEATEKAREEAKKVVIPTLVSILGDGYGGKESMPQAENLAKSPDRPSLPTEAHQHPPNTASLTQRETDHVSPGHQGHHKGDEKQAPCKDHLRSPLPRYVCPYASHDGQTHSECFLAKLNTIFEVQRHLLASHYPSYCRTCEMNTEHGDCELSLTRNPLEVNALTELQQRLKARDHPSYCTKCKDAAAHKDCKRRPVKNPLGLAFLTDDKAKAALHLNSTGSDEDLWRQLYSICLPWGQTTFPSPYVDDNILLQEKQIEEYARDGGRGHDLLLHHWAEKESENWCALLDRDDCISLAVTDWRSKALKKYCHTYWERSASYILFNQPRHLSMNRNDDLKLLGNLEKISGNGQLLQRNSITSSQPGSLLDNNIQDASENCKAAELLVAEEHPGGEIILDLPDDCLRRPADMSKQELHQPRPDNFDYSDVWQHVQELRSILSSRTSHRSPSYQQGIGPLTYSTDGYISKEELTAWYPAGLITTGSAYSSSEWTRSSSSSRRRPGQISVNAQSRTSTNDLYIKRRKRTGSNLESLRECFPPGSLLSSC